MSAVRTACGAHPSVVLLTVGRDVSCADTNGHKGINPMSYFTLSVSMCAGVSGSGPGQEYMAPSTAADPHVRGHPPGDMEYGMYSAQCVCVYA